MSKMENIGHEIWKSVRNISRAGLEIDAIEASLQEKIESSDIGYQHKKSDNIENFYVTKAFCFWGEIASSDKRKKNPLGYLTYSFSLWRDEDDTGTTWPEAKQAKIYVGYASFEVGSWSNEDLFLDGDAHNPDVTHLRGENSSLWEWSGKEETNTEPWNRRSWFYVVPLDAINSQKDIDVNLVTPVVKLLKDGKANPDEVLGKTSALVFNG